jgi:outer membrane protein
MLVVLALGCALAGEFPDRPLSMEECIRLGLERNPSLEMAREEARSAEASLRRVLSGYYPTATWVGTKGRTGGASFVETEAGTIPFATSASRAEAEVALGYVVWELGRGDSLRSAQRSLQASSASEEGAKQELILSVSQLYYAALASEQLVGVAEATLRAAQDHEKLVQARSTVGEAAAVDVIPAEADRAEAEFLLLQAENEANLARARLKRTMGAPPIYELRLAPPPPLQVGEDAPELAEAVELAIARRPELAASRSSVSAGEYGLRLSRKLERGSLRVLAEYDRGIAGPKEGESWSAIVSASVPLFDGGGRKADADAARARLGLLRAQERQLIDQVGLDVESALLEVETSRKSIEAAGKSVASAEAQLAAAEGKYREGVGIFVEILDAQKAVARARTNSVQASYNYQTALVGLRKAMGLLEAPDGSE